MEDIRDLFRWMIDMAKLLIAAGVLLLVFQLLKSISGYSSWELSIVIFVVITAYQVFIFSKKLKFSFRTDIRIVPKWELILKDLFPEVKENRLKKYLSMAIKKGELQEVYEIVEYYDYVSGLTQIWHNNENTPNKYYLKRIYVSIADFNNVDDGHKTLEIDISPVELTEYPFLADKDPMSYVVSKIPLSEFNKLVSSYFNIDSWSRKNGLNWLIDDRTDVAKYAWFLRFRAEFFSGKELLSVISKYKDFVKDVTERIKELERKKKIARFDKKLTEESLGGYNTNDIEGIFKSKYCTWNYRVKISYPFSV